MSLRRSTVGEHPTGRAEHHAVAETGDGRERDEARAVRLVEQPHEQADPEDRVAGTESPPPR